MSIYPVLPGQKSEGENVIPPRKEEAASNAHGKGQEEDGLIDFGDGGAAKAAAPGNTQRQPDDIESMLNATGKPAEGSLIDFAKERPEPSSGDLLKF